MQLSLKSIQTFLRNHHVIIFTVLAIITLSAVIVLSYRTVIAASDTTGYQAYQPETFDAQAITMLDEFQDEQSEKQPTNPRGERSNPFVE